MKQQPRNKLTSEQAIKFNCSKVRIINKYFKIYIIVFNYSINSKAILCRFFHHRESSIKESILNRKREMPDAPIH